MATATDIEYRTTHGDAMRAALAMPEGPGPHPGVVVLHEAFGLNDDMRRITTRFADAGYAAITPDLYSHGNKAICLARVMAAGMAGLNPAVVVDDITAARTHLAGVGNVDSSRMAVIGFCMGGNFALIVAPRGGYRAASVNYGAPPHGDRALDGICPVVGSFGALDTMFTKQVPRLERLLDSQGVAHDLKIYEGVGHSFMSFDNEPRWMTFMPTLVKAGHDEEAAEDSWRRILAFFDDHVKGAA